MKVLWLAREIPHPLLSGDKIYSAKIAESLSHHVDLVMFAGLSSSNLYETTSLSQTVEWYPIQDSARSQISFFLTTSMPMAAARNRTVMFVNAIRKMLGIRKWDAIVLDHYAMAWCLKEIRQSSYAGPIVHFSHDYETAVTRAIHKAYRGNFFKKLILRENSRRTSNYEKLLARESKLITAITDDDRYEFQRIGSNAKHVTLTPGYDGKSTPFRTISPQTPRRAVAVGSFDWVAKQLNLLRFIEAADTRMYSHDVELRIIGKVPHSLRDRITSFATSVKILGFVDNMVDEFSNARIALVFEETGGGFKLKMLDYIFNRVPLFGLEHAMRGLPSEIMKHVITAPTIDALVDVVVREIDNVTLLDDMQEGAYKEAAGRFRWDERGKILADAIAAI